MTMDKLEQDRISEIWNSLTEDDRHRAGLLYKSPARKLDGNTYTQALKDCMMAAEVWPGHSKFLMEDGAREYEDILAAQQLMDRL